MKSPDNQADHQIHGPSAGEVPHGNVAGLFKYFRADVTSGFLVFLIALPLCLGIAMASGFPPIAGILTAIVGGILTGFISNSELTIKGPAAGLIVIALGCVTEFSAAIKDADMRTDGAAMVQGARGSATAKSAVAGDAAAPGEASSQAATHMKAYRLALAVGVAAAVFQILFGLLRAGALGDFFPAAAVHGMLAAIGIIIIAKQSFTLIGVEAVEKEEAIKQILEFPARLGDMNPEIACIGLISLLLLFLVPLFTNPVIRKIPVPIMVLLIAVPLGLFFDLDHKHMYFFLNHEYAVGPGFLVTLPANLLAAVTLPDFSALATFIGWKYVVMFALVGSLESIVSARAIDLLDPYKRKTDLNRDQVAVGLANLVANFIGGLPMISEIVRSSANRNNGAKTRFANMYHGLFLLLFVALFPALIHSIPLTALAAMLIYTGYRLAAPREWIAVSRIGIEQLVIFSATVVAVLATDLLIGVALGILLKFLFVMHHVHYRLGPALFTGKFDVVKVGDKSYRVTVHHAAVFSNWIPLKNRLAALEADHDVIINLAETLLVDHTVMEKIHELEHDFHQANRKLMVEGLENHSSMSKHSRSARWKAAKASL